MKTTRLLGALLGAGLSLSLAAGAPAAEQPAPAFTKKPSAAKNGDKVTISFAVDRETDVAVFIEDAKGRVVRHLAAGVLGKNAPKAFKSGSLEQSVEWDGKADWGKPAGAGPFKARVALGLGARYDKILASDPETLGKFFSLAVGPDGTLYAATEVAFAGPNWFGRSLTAFNRDGSYARQMIPLPSSASKERIAYMNGVPVEADGRVLPAITDIRNRGTTAFSPEIGGMMTVTGDGLLLVPEDTGIAALPTGDALPAGRYLGTALTLNGKQLGFSADAALAVSGDGAWVYVTGLAVGKPATRTDGGGQRIPAVFRVKLADRSTIETVFGDPEKSGSDGNLLSYPYGLAIDGKGHLFIADRDSNRVVVISEKDRSVAGTMAVEAPMLVAADGGTGAVYVLRSAGGKKKGMGAELAKYASWKDAKPAATVQFEVGSSTARPLMALDAGAKPVTVWCASYYSLMRFEDQGAKFSEPKRIGGGKSSQLGRLGFEDVVVDHYRPEPEIYTRLDGGQFLRFNEATGKSEPFTPKQGIAGGAAGMCLVPGPDGLIYALAWPSNFFRMDHDGNPLKWESPSNRTPGWQDEGQKRYVTDGRSVYVNVCMVYMTHTMGIRPDGRLFVFEAAANKVRGAKQLLEFEPSGKLVGPSVIRKVSDACVGPKFDQEGNIYIAEQVKLPGEVVPPEYRTLCGDTKIGARWSRSDPRGNPPQMYGSIIKFSPKGGMIDCKQWNTPYQGEPGLDPGLKSVDAVVCQGDSERFITEAKVIGAEWMRACMNHIEIHYCNCENSRFDVDPFGRVWYPDLGLYRVGVLDTNGNPICHFGGYGNADSRGPESTDKKLAQPEIAFSWLLGVGVTDKYAYMGDGLNRRFLRARLVYAAEETCAIQ